MIIYFSFYTLDSLQVSLILPVVNEAEFIDCAINSILNQKFKNKISFEILIADGGSTDGTLPIIHNIISYNSQYQAWMI